MLENRIAARNDAVTIYTRQRSAKPRGRTSKEILKGQQDKLPTNDGVV